MSDVQAPAQSPAAPATTSTAIPTQAAPAAPTNATPPAAAPQAQAPVVVNVQAPAAAPPAAPAANAAPPVEEPPQEGKEPGWLKDRLARAEKAALKRLGVDSEDEAKAALAAHKAKQEEAKSIELKRVEAEQALAAERSRATSLLSVVQSQADAEMAKITPAQQAAVIALAGDDPAKRLSTIIALRPTWAAPVAPAAPSVAAPPAAAPAAAPAQDAAPMVQVIRLPDGRLAQIIDASAPSPAVAPTAPPAAAAPVVTQATPPTNVSTAPPPGGPPAQAATETTVLGKHESLSKMHPTAGALYARANAARLERELKKS